MGLDDPGRSLSRTCYNKLTERAGGQRCGLLKHRLLFRTDMRLQASTTRFNGHITIGLHIDLQRQNGLVDIVRQLSVH